MRNYLLFFIFLILTIACQPGDTPDDHNHERPNILFLIADDWSYPHASVYGDRVIQTPTFDHLAQQGAIFNNAFCAAPSCSPSRAAILTSRYPHQLESAGNLWSIMPRKFPNWVQILEENGYHTGKTQKGWGPGDFQRGGYEHNPAGEDYPSFQTFLEERKEGQPFCFWFGSTDPHRSYERNSGIKTGMDASRITVPGFLPDLECVRNDILDYYFEVERFDRECGNIINHLRKIDELENTLIVMTSDNGMPFPRAKANLYDYGTRMPLAIFWDGVVTSGLKVEDFMNFIDFGPTFLDAAGIDIPEDFSGQSLLPLLKGDSQTLITGNMVFLERERHANVRAGDLSYPCRAIRTKDHLYIRNFEPNRWPAGDPATYQSVGQYGDIDNSITKFLIMDHESSLGDSHLFDLAFGKRPTEELYILSEDPYNLKNVASDKKYEVILKQLRTDLDQWMQESGDLRVSYPQTIYWDTVEYTPDYQFKNFDLEQEIAAYQRLEPTGYGRFKKVPCK